MYFTNADKYSEADSRNKIEENKKKERKGKETIDSSKKSIEIGKFRETLSLNIPIDIICTY